MRQPVKPKPNDVAETQRVLRIFKWLMGEIAKDYGPAFLADAPTFAASLEVAERIAARTVSE